MQMIRAQSEADLAETIAASNSLSDSQESLSDYTPPAG